MRLETHYGKAEVSTYRTRATALKGTPVIPESEFSGRPNHVLAAEIDVQVMGEAIELLQVGTNVRERRAAIVGQAVDVARLAADLGDVRGQVAVGTCVAVVGAEFRRKVICDVEDTVRVVSQIGFRGRGGISGKRADGKRGGDGERGECTFCFHGG